MQTKRQLEYGDEREWLGGELAFVDDRRSKLSEQYLGDWHDQ
jgi:hypothetical protein